MLSIRFDWSTWRRRPAFTGERRAHTVIRSSARIGSQNCPKRRGNAPESGPATNPAVPARAKSPVAGVFAILT
jgi:hypothetical protein